MSQSISYSFQWNRGETAITGATTESYELVAADGDATITCTVTATNAAGSTSATSPPTSVVDPSSSAAALLWSVGDTVSGALSTALYQQTPQIGMVSQWYNGPDDITQYLYSEYNPTNGTKRPQLEKLWAEGKCVELIIYPNNGNDGRPAGSGSDSTTTTTPGMAMNRYCLSSQCLTDVANLVEWFSPPAHPGHVVLFTEFQGGTYGLPSGYTSSTWEAALMNQVVKIVGAVHEVSSQTKVGIGFAGYVYGPGQGPYRDFGPYTAAAETCDVLWCQNMRSAVDVDREGRSMLYPVAINFGQSVENSGLNKPWGISHSQIWSGGATGIISGALSTPLAGTSQLVPLSITSGSDAFPAAPFYATLYQQDDTTAQEAVERVLVTASNGGQSGTWTIERGDNGVVTSLAPGAYLAHCVHPDFMGRYLVDQTYNANPAGRCAYFQSDMLCNATELEALKAQGLFSWNLMIGNLEGPAGQDAGAWITFTGSQIATLSGFIEDNSDTFGP